MFLVDNSLSYRYLIDISFYYGYQVFIVYYISTSKSGMHTKLGVPHYFAAMQLTQQNTGLTFSNLLIDNTQ